MCVYYFFTSVRAAMSPSALDKYVFAFSTAAQLWLAHFYANSLLLSGILTYETKANRLASISICCCSSTVVLVFLPHGAMFTWTPLSCRQLSLKLLQAHSTKTKTCEIAIQLFAKNYTYCDLVSSNYGLIVRYWVWEWYGWLMFTRNGAAKSR